MFAFLVKNNCVCPLIKLLYRTVLVVHTDVFSIDIDIRCPRPGSGLRIYGNCFSRKCILYIGTGCTVIDMSLSVTLRFASGREPVAFALFDSLVLRLNILHVILFFRRFLIASRRRLQSGIAFIRDHVHRSSIIDTCVDLPAGNSCIAVKIHFHI